ncbi:hypothetical protein G7Y89_g10454 [Cudoniella acicularis]|uniref:NB-ARC domain-containing protein n=1 Tax=Cudoniella acicularis TaxID=354080 RepID=A0A8H4RFG2_9HELO|nr:hypothetical protein G7Y89_g10454 [Cudoniella acicularis]
MRKWLRLKHRSENAAREDPTASTTATSPRKTFPFGIKLLHDPENSVVDIVFVHGLTGDREKTWTAKNAAAPWPQSLLPSKVPNARVLSFGYDAYVTDWKGVVSKNRIGNHSMNLLTHVATYRVDDDTALVAARQRPEQHLKNILEYTRGIIFLGTPHHGSGLAKWAEMLANVIGLLKQTNPQILAVLESDSEVLARVQDGFHTMVRSRNQERLQPIEITCFYEELPLPGIGVVVPSHSAILPGYTPIGIRSNHMDMTKFEHADDPGFTLVAGELRRWIKELTVPSNTSAPGAERSEQGKLVRQQDNTQFAFPSSNPVAAFAGTTVPFRRDPDFVDRDILSEINQKCSLPASRVALVGLGGVGKSQLAIEYSHRIQEESPETWVFWVHASTTARFEEGYRRIAEKVKIDGWDKPDVDILQLVTNWLCNEVNGRWVMIVDNADDPNVFFISSANHGLAQVARSLSDFLPQSRTGSIVITSRSRSVAYRLIGRDSDIIKVKPMDQDQALALLHKKLPVNLDTTDAIELVRTLDYIPLAISQAAAYINQGAPRITVSRYLHDLRRSDKDRASLLKKDIGDTRRDGKASNSIIATWHISFEHIRKDRLSAARLLSLMSLFDRQGIPDTLLQHSYQEDSNIETDFEDDISTLTGYSLITMNAEGKEFEMHRLVQFSTKKWLELYDKLENWKEKYIKIIGKAFPVGRYENWTTCQQLFPHAEMVLSYWPMNRDYGKYEQAEEMNRRALEGWEKALGKEHPNTLTSVDNLATVLESQGKYEQAEEMNRRALEGKEKALGKEHPSTLMSVYNLAYLLHQQEQYQEALLLYQRASTGYKKTLGPDHPTTKACLKHFSLLQPTSHSPPS